MKVKVGTKYVWQDRVRQQTSLVHLLEDVYGIRINVKAFSFYPNYLYFGMPISRNPKLKESKTLWNKIIKIFEKNRWKVYAAYKHINPNKKLPINFKDFEDLGLDHVQILLSELVIMDLNYPSHGVGQQIELSTFQPLIGFTKSKVSRVVEGRPGSFVVKYKKDKELLNVLDKISKRKSFKKEPFYIRKNSKKGLKSIYKGRDCLDDLIKNF